MAIVTHRPDDAPNGYRIRGRHVLPGRRKAVIEGSGQTDPPLQHLVGSR